MRRSREIKLCSGSYLLIGLWTSKTLNTGFKPQRRRPAAHCGTASEWSLELLRLDHIADRTNIWLPETWFGQQRPHTSLRTPPRSTILSVCHQSWKKFIREIQSDVLWKNTYPLLYWIYSRYWPRLDPVFKVLEPVNEGFCSPIYRNMYGRVPTTFPEFPEVELLI